MNSLRFFLATLFFVAMFVLYISSTSTINIQNSESSILNPISEKEFVVDTNKNTIPIITEDHNQENRQNISSYEQKTNNTYEQDDPNKVIETRENVELKPYSPEMFDSLYTVSVYN